MIDMPDKQDQDTQPGHEMPKTFNFAEAEARLYAWWEQNGWFKPEAAPKDAEPFVISMPPPNVTGELHLGHPMFVGIEDCDTPRTDARQSGALGARAQPRRNRHGCRWRKCCATKAPTGKTRRSFCRTGREREIRGMINNQCAYSARL
jgi:hypothetical protein